MQLNPKTTNFGSQLSPYQKSMVEIAKSEQLDEFVELRSVKESVVEYSTVHGLRILNSDRPGKNIFFVVEDRAGFARGNLIPYEFQFHYLWELLPPEELAVANLDEVIDVSILVVNLVLPQEPAAEAGWAKAVELPYYLIRDDFFDKSILIVGDGGEEAKAAGYARAVPLPYNRYLPNSQSPRLASDLRPIPAAVYAAYAKATQLPDEAYLRFHSTCCFTVRIPNSLEVRISSQNDEATSAGYANAIPVAMSRSDVCIEDLRMPNTDYADSLVDFPRFG